MSVGSLHPGNTQAIEFRQTDSWWEMCSSALRDKGCCSIPVVSNLEVESPQGVGLE